MPSSKTFYLGSGITRLIVVYFTYSLDFSLAFQTSCAQDWTCDLLCQNSFPMPCSLQCPERHVSAPSGTDQDEWSFFKCFFLLALYSVHLWVWLDRGWDGWMASLTWWTCVWVNSGSWWWTGSPGVLQSWGRKELDMTERLSWTELSAATVWGSQLNSLPTYSPILHHSQSSSFDLGHDSLFVGGEINTFWYFKY